jgi:hypothetical protein
LLPRVCVEGNELAGKIMYDFETAEAGSDDDDVMGGGDCHTTGCARDFRQFIGRQVLQTSATTSRQAISGLRPNAVRSMISRRAKDELIFVTCGIAESHSLWMRS